MTERTDVFLGVIAASVLIMALVQVGMVVAALIAARKVNALTRRVEREIEPVVAHAHAIVHQVQEGVMMATEKVHRFEDSVVRIADRVEGTVGTVQSGIMVPAREGAALVAGAKAVMRALRRSPSTHVQ
jgi:L,D-peptidoglycan transpeptidase YkuD (ErfK/YbiS/YcfS/YnhG family)